MPLKYVGPSKTLVVKDTGRDRTVVSHLLPPGVPPGATIKLKGVVVKPPRYQINGEELVWNPPISIYAPVSIWDGEALLWEWTAAGGQRDLTLLDK